jgi:hypothetical protein
VREQPVDDVAAAYRSLLARDLSLEGIPMVIVLEDLAGDAAPEGSEPERRTGAAYAALVEAYHAQLVAEAPEGDAALLYRSLELLAAHHFEPDREQ